MALPFSTGIAAFHLVQLESLMSNNDFGNTPNPYEATSPVPLGTPVSAKPVSLTVFGIINIVWGLMSLCGFGWTAVQMAIMGSQPQEFRDPTLEMMETNTTYFAFMVTSMGLGFFAAIALIAGGIGLLNGKPYGRTLSIVYAAYAILFGIIGIVFNLLFMVEPTMAQIEEIAQGPERTAAMAGIIGAFVGFGICGMIYPIVLLIFMMRGPIVQYMRSQQHHA